MSSAYFWTIVAYMVFLIGVGALRSRRVESQEDFSVAGRQLSTFVLFGTMLATWIGTGSIFGFSGKIYEVGIAAWILPVGSQIGIILLSFLASRARRSSAITVQDILETRYNKWARVFGVITLVLTAVTIVSYQYRAAAAVLNLAMPSIDLKTATIIVAVFIIIYTALAGMFSVAYTDLVMGITMIVGILVTLPYVYSKAGGYAGMAATLPPDHLVFFGPISWVQAAGIILPPGLLILGDANMRDHLPIWLGALVMTTIVAIIVSTSISYLLVPATSIARDIYQRFINPKATERKLVWLLRGLVIGLGIVAFIISTFSEKFLEIALRAYTIYGTGITPSLVAALTWKRATAQGAVTSIIMGVATTLIWEFGGFGTSTGVDPVIPAIAVSVLCLIGVSLLTPAPRSEQVDVFFQEGN